MTIHIYPEIKGIPQRQDFSVRIRKDGGEWSELPTYEANVDMHNVSQASFASFDMEGPVVVEITYLLGDIASSIIRPLSYGIGAQLTDNTISFLLDQPRKLSIEINGGRFNNLHLFANPIEVNAPSPGDENVILVKPGIHRTEHLLRPLTTPRSEGNEQPDTLYFLPGLHYIEETLLKIPSSKNIYIAGGAAVVGSMVCDHARDVTIRGRGIVYLAEFHRFTAFRGVRILFSSNIEVEGITTLNPPHYSIYIGGSEHIRIHNFKSFSCEGWSDGIDIMSSSHIDIDDIFLRTSDDSIAIYGSRWDYVGDSRHITVRNSSFWADVAHPLMIGTHGNYHKKGDVIEHIRFENIDILEHHEPQENYQGAMTINAGDLNTVRHITYDNIRVEHFELGRLFDIRVVWNKDYNPVPGNRIEDIVFQNIEYNGQGASPSRIHGYNEERYVAGVRIKNVKVNGEKIMNADHTSLDINEYAHQVTFE